MGDHGTLAGARIDLLTIQYVWVRADDIGLGDDTTTRPFRQTMIERHYGHLQRERAAQALAGLVL